MYVAHWYIGGFNLFFFKHHFLLILLRTGTLGCLFEVKNNGGLDDSAWFVNRLMLLSVDLNSDTDFYTGILDWRQCLPSGTEIK